jgi:hypothetical protein
MGAAESSSRSCAPDSLGDTLFCGFSPRSKVKEGAPAMDGPIAEAAQVVVRWIAAREAGDREVAASCCHTDFAFASAQLSLQGLEAAKERLFAQRAPTPVDTIKPLQLKEGSTKERPVFFRVVKFTLGQDEQRQELKIRQEWVVIPSFPPGSPLIGSVSASRA